MLSMCDPLAGGTLRQPPDEDVCAPQACVLSALALSPTVAVSHGIVLAMEDIERPRIQDVIHEGADRGMSFRQLSCVGTELLLKEV
jgi:hypothetical protein